MPKLLAQGVLALRENCIMPRLVNSDYSTIAAQQGDVVNIPVPSAIAIQPVTPDRIAPVTTDITTTSSTITLNKWYEAPFYMSDRDIMEIMNGSIPMQASEAIKAVGNQINSDIMALYKGLYGFAGSPGTTPFGVDVSEATDARKVLNKQLAPLTDRRFVMDPDAEAQALGLRAFQDMSYTGGAGAINDGMIKNKLGFSWYMDQMVPSHTKGAENGAYTTTAAGFALGTKTIPLITGAGTIVVGDVVTFAGDTQTYVVTTGIAAPGSIVIEPGLKIAIPAIATAVTVKGVASTAYPQNLAFHRDCFGFASRPLADSAEGLGNLIQSVADPVSGIAIRLEVSREHKRTRYSFDVLYGCDIVRRELGVRVWG
jgi:hypothetical protein